MIKSFSVNKVSVDEFIKKVADSLSQRELGKIASVSLHGENIIITFSKLGKSEVVYTLKNFTEGFQCIHKSEKISLTHKAFRSEMESKLTRVLESNGAQVES